MWGNQYREREHCLHNVFLFFLFTVLLFSYLISTTPKKKLEGNYNQCHKIFTDITESYMSKLTIPYTFIAILQRKRKSTKLVKIASDIGRIEDLNLMTTSLVHGLC